jgi:hypothetical protein
VAAAGVSPPVHLKVATLHHQPRPQLTPLEETIHLLGLRLREIRCLRSSSCYMLLSIKWQVISPSPALNRPTQLWNFPDFPDFPDFPLRLPSNPRGNAASDSNHNLVAGQQRLAPTLIPLLKILNIPRSHGFVGNLNGGWDYIVFIPIVRDESLWFLISQFIIYNPITMNDWNTTNSDTEHEIP